MVHRRIRAALSLALVLSGAAGCIGRVIPIAPPGIDGTDVSLITCAGENCPADGVSVHIHGSAEAGAIVFAVNRTRSFSDGREYQASAVAAVGGMPGDGGAPTAPGSYDLWLEPQPDPAGGTLVSRHGDMLQVFQLVRQPDNTFEQSSGTTVTVP